MKSTLIWSLAGLNLLLAAVLVAKVTPGTPAHAQAARRPSDYLMIPGQAVGVPYSVVYIVDTTTGTLGAMAYDDTKRRLETIPPIDLNRMFAAGGGGGGETPRGGYKR